MCVDCLFYYGRLATNWLAQMSERSTLGRSAANGPFSGRWKTRTKLRCYFLLSAQKIVNPSRIHRFVFLRSDWIFKPSKALECCAGFACSARSRRDRNDFIISTYICIQRNEISLFECLSYGGGFAFWKFSIFFCSKEIIINRKAMSIDISDI